jgi:flagellar biosynthesis/type III secretory pathway protein FliH
VAEMSLSDSKTSREKALLVKNSQEFVPDYFSFRKDSSLESFKVWDPLGSSGPSASDVDRKKKELSDPNPHSKQNRLFQQNIEPDNNALEEEYNRGFKDGKAASDQDMEKKSSEIVTLLGLLKSGQCDVSEYYSPLKTLAVRIAEAILKVELNESRESIEKIVTDLLEEAAPSGVGPATLHLSQDDLNLLSTEFISEYEDVKVIADAKLSRGSAYVEMNDRLITDLKEDRIEAVVQKVIRHG